jgi:hypothetical protein
MPNKKKITLEEAQGLYAKNEALREFLESKFSKEELTANTTPPQEVETLEETPEQKFKRVWEEKILTQCDRVQFLNAYGGTTKIPNSRIQVLNKEGERLFEYNHSGKSKYFWYSHSKVHVLLTQEVSSNVKVLQGLIKSWVEDSIGLQGAIPLVLKEI